MIGGRTQWAALAAVAAGLALAALGPRVSLGGEYLYVGVVLTALAAMVVGGASAIHRRSEDGSIWLPAERETGIQVPTPGADLATAPDHRIKRRIRRQVVAALDCAPEEAEARIDAGAWTDDPLAATYLSSDRTVSRARRLVAFLRGDRIEDRARRRAVAALRALRGEGDA